MFLETMSLGAICLLPMGQELSNEQLLDIERHIEEIDQALDILDPSNAIEAQEIEAKTYMLRSYVTILENQKARPTLQLVN
ncbi:MAG: hypothetical protein JNM39_16330 [Bdellovibrionaceae bacterium]|nr:hypothetical protein [Pseudobdellovibrionaceae bacterium]